MKCAIYGAGSLGTVLGAYMTKGGVPVELVNRNRAHVDALREKGAHITGTVDFSTPVTAITPEKMTAPYDVIFLMTKQLHNKEVVTFLKPLLAPDGVIVTFQNGIPEPGIAEIVGESHTIGCVVEWGATMDPASACSRATRTASHSIWAACRAFRTQSSRRFVLCLRKCARWRWRITSSARAGRSSSSTRRSPVSAPLWAACSAM